MSLPRLGLAEEEDDGVVMLPVWSVDENRYQEVKCWLVVGLAYILYLLLGPVKLSWGPSERKWRNEVARDGAAGSTI